MIDRGYYRRMAHAALVLGQLAGCGSCEGGGAGSPDGGGVPGTPCTTADAACTSRVEVGSAGLGVPYYRTLPIDRALPGIRRAVVVVHGTGRDADKYFSTMVDAATEVGALPYTVVIAPHFQTDPNTVCSGSTDAPDPADLYWACNDWKHGEPSLNDPLVDSYDVLDALVVSLARHLPDLERITVAGHSAGGQVAHRYAAAHVADAATNEPPLRFVVANPSSYLYFDDRRLTASAVCDGPSACVLDANSFVAPYHDAANCPGYDRYPYGLVARGGYTSSLADAQLRTQYVGRDVVQLLGALDSDASVTAGYADLDVTCGAMADGPVGQSYRLQRGLAYHAYVQLLGAGHPLDVVPGCGHSQACMFGSVEARARIFGN